MILKDRVAIVTGAGSGIGRAGAVLLAREGATLVVLDRNRDDRRGNGQHDPGRRQRRRSRMLSTSPTTTQLSAVIADVLARYGRIDILHNHAGAQVPGDLETVDPDGFDRSWDLNVRAHFMAARLVMPAMKAARQGRDPQHVLEFRRAL